MLELLLVGVLAGVLATLAVPAFSTLLLDADMVAQVNRYVHGIHLARQEAEKYGTDAARSAGVPTAGPATMHKPGSRASSFSSTAIVTIRRRSMLARQSCRLGPAIRVA